jgi:hypothetical protein
MDPIKQISTLGVRSEHAYIAGAAAVALSFGSWVVSRFAKDSKSQSDRWGLFIGEWAPTLFAIGIALKLSERHDTRE